jgi:cyclic pyranopterin phosphate synthase
VPRKHLPRGRVPRKSVPRGRVPRKSLARAKLSHVRSDGSVTMVDVGAKALTQRSATAQALVRMNDATYRALKAGTLKKGDALATAQTAGILAAKRTSELIPLCHPLLLTDIRIVVTLAQKNCAAITCTVRCSGQTGVEMEALTGATVAALTIYDMCKAMDRGMTIDSVALLEKSGGRSGAYRR